jgi:hypothetical protein
MITLRKYVVVVLRGHQRAERRELDEVAGERVEHADGGGVHGGLRARTRRPSGVRARSS